MYLLPCRIFEQAAVSNIPAAQLRFKNSTRFRILTKPYCLIAYIQRGGSADICSHGKNKYNAEICERFVQNSFITVMPVRTQRLNRTPHIAYTHSAGICMPPHLMERLNLQSAHKRKSVFIGINGLSADFARCGHKIL